MNNLESIMQDLEAVSNEKQFMFERPAHYFRQGNQTILFITCYWKDLERLLTLDNYRSVLERSQRELNVARAKKFAAYLVKNISNGTDFIVPPIIGNCSGDIEIEPVGNTHMCMVKFPFDCKIEPFDGQHRSYGIIEVTRSNSEARHNAIGIQLTLNAPLSVRQQFFSDINNNASKPSAAINMAYDSNNALAQLVQQVLTDLPVLQNQVDFEHNVIPAKGKLWVSYKALCDASQKMLSFRQEDDSEDKQKEDLIALWNAWLLLFDMSSNFKHYEYCDYRKEYLPCHAVAVNAFGWAVRELLEELDLNKVVSLIESLALKLSLSERESFSLTENWKGICVDPERGTLRADVRSQKKAGKVLAQIIRTGKVDISQPTAENIEK